MSICPSAIAEGLLDALEVLDQKTAPFGLYACEEYRAKTEPFPRLHQEWHLALKPRLQQLGCRTMGPGPIADRGGPTLAGTYFTTADGTGMRMVVARISKVKVRKFGSAYRVDPQKRFRERWDELRLHRILGQLWTPSEVNSRDQLHLLLLICFAKEEEPFAAELSELDQQIHWRSHGAQFLSRTWLDSYERGLHVRLCAWARRALETP